MADTFSIITWVSFVLSLVVGLFGVYYILNKPRVKSDKVPQVAISDLRKIYGPKNLGQQNTRYLKLLSRFEKQFGCTAEFVVRTPGRVNLIGEHIDYSDYPVFPMAVFKDVLIAVGKRKDSKIALANVDMAFSDHVGPLSVGALDKVISEHKWTQFFGCAFKGVLDHYSKAWDSRADAQKTLTQGSGGFNMMVDGNIPMGAGMSSSSAMVCGFVTGILHGNQKFSRSPPLSVLQIAELCICCERYAGVMSGGMDQTIIMAGGVRHVEFKPKLSAAKVVLPFTNDSVIAITDCLRPHNLRESHYNVRVIECRLAACVLAKHLGLKEWAVGIKTLRDVQIRTGNSLSTMMVKTMNLLKMKAYSWIDLCDEFEDTDVVDLLHGLSSAPSTLKDLRAKGGLALDLYKRALHVYTEANRVETFRVFCDKYKNKRSTTALLERMGEILNKSHESCRDLFDCSCSELDELRQVCLAGGSLGTRLTGAGWGGALLSLVPKANLYKFEKAIKQNYYSKFQSLPLNFYFVTNPCAGTTIVKL